MVNAFVQMDITYNSINLVSLNVLYVLDIMLLPVITLLKHSHAIKLLHFKQMEFVHVVYNIFKIKILIHVKNAQMILPLFVTISTNLKLVLIFHSQLLMANVNAQLVSIWTLIRKIVSLVALLHRNAIIHMDNLLNVSKHFNTLATGTIVNVQ